MGNIRSSIPDWLIDYDAFEQTPDVSFKDIGLTAATNSALGSILLIYWTIKRWNNPAYFSPKRADRPPDLPSPRFGIFAWVSALLSIDETSFLRYAGFDAFMYVRMYLLAAKISAAVAVYAICVVLPINITGGNISDTVNGSAGFSSWSMSNVPSKDPVLWAHVVGTLLLTVAAFFFLNKEFRAYTRLRHTYLKLRAPHMRTIMLEGVPPEMRSAAQIFVYFNHLYPNSIASVSCIQDLKSLRILIQKREKVLRVLERLLLKRPKEGFSSNNSAKFQCCCSEDQTEEKIDKYHQKLEDLNTKIKQEQTLRLQRMQMVDRRILREIEAGGYLANENSPRRVQRGYNDQTRGALNGVDIEEYLVRLGARLGIGDSSHDDSAFERIVSDSYLADDENIRRSRSSRYGRSSFSLKFSTSSKQGFSGYFEGIWVKAKSGIGWVFQSCTTGFDGRAASMNYGERQALLPPASTNHELELNGMGPRAFVTFKTFSGATIARQVHHTSRVGTLRVFQAPEPRDVYWSNAHISRSQRSRRRILVDIFLLLLYFFWVVPVTLLYLIFSEEALTARFEWFDDLCNAGSYFCTILGTIQPVVLLGLMNLLPPLIRGLGIVQGSEAESWNQKQTLSRYFTFQIINVFFATTVAGTIFDTLSMIVDSPSTVLTLLGESLPKVCGFFCEYVMIKMFSGLSIELSRFFSLIQHSLIILVWPGDTKRDRNTVVIGLRRYEDPGWFNYPKFIAQDLLVVAITFTFACINPFILVVSIPYYLAAYVVYKHQMLYVYEPLFESGGTFFPKIFRRFIFAVFISQATMAGVLILKEAYYQAVAIVILMLLTWIFKAQQRGYFEPVSNSLPLEIATVLDMESENPFDESTQPLSATTPFMQPELKAKPNLYPEPQW